jgi:3-hydroxyisobutyrate dehydrogenase-like beta-hydroxyacid dehydrogenase
MTDQIKRVAVIGIGSMGNHMARHILDAGFDLTVCDTRSEVLASFAEMGVRAVGTPVECVDCDAVLILVATPEQLRKVSLGAQGLREIAPEHMPRYVVAISTVTPGDMSDLVQGFTGSTVRIIDAPVSGGVVGARKATLTFLVGGLDEDIVALRPLFLSMGKTIFHCGPVGAGQTTKTINNIIAISNLMISAEAYSIALAAGLTLEHLIPALEAGSGRNFLSREPTDPPEVYAAWSGTEQEFQSVATINRKDIDLALALGSDGLELPAIRALQGLLREAGDETLANWRTIASHI